MDVMDVKDGEDNRDEEVLIGRKFGREPTQEIPEEETRWYLLILAKGDAERVRIKFDVRAEGGVPGFLRTAWSPRSEEPQSWFECGSEAVDPAELRWLL